jgi:hypothetical protein
MAATKLTLTVEEGIIEKMKGYAAARHSSVSRIVESYFALLTSPDKTKAQEQVAVSSFVEGLTLKGMEVELPKDFTPEEEVAHYLEEKYK